MNIDQLSVKLRPRNRWEAADVGFAMGRKWFVPLWLLWLAVAIPFEAVLVLILIYGLQWHPAWVFVLFWWFKPMFEQPLLYFLSRALFGEQLRVRDVLRQWWKVVSPQLLQLLTIRRLSFSRSFDNPVAMLEQLRGKDRKQRLNVLHRRQGSVSVWLHIGCAFIEIILYASFVLLFYTLVPSELDLFDLNDWYESETGWMAWLDAFFNVLAISIVAPFYVSAGFALYIARRGELEAWDIELQFKQLRQRVLESRQKKNGGGATKAKALSTVVALVCSAVFWLVQPQQVYAADEVVQEMSEEDVVQSLEVPCRDSAASVQQAETCINAVMDSDAFGRTEESTRWKPKKTTEEEVELEERSWFYEMMKKLVDWLYGDGDDKEGESEEGSGAPVVATILEVLLWAAAVALVAFILYHAAKWANAMGWIRLPERVQPKEPLPTELFGLKVDKESLPDDVAAKARQLFMQGKWREGLALLYRASLTCFIHDDGLEIRSSFTEQECVQLVRNERPTGQAQYFARLTQLWLPLAYGHEAPIAEQAMQLCQEWGAHFDTTGNHKANAAGSSPANAGARA